MAHAGKVMIAIVAGGTLMGSLLGSFASPVMKAAPEAPWGDQLVAPGLTSASNTYIEPLPENLTPPYGSDGYAPAFAYSELPEMAQDDFSSLEFAGYEDDYALDEPVERMTSGTRTDFVQVAEAAVAAEAAAEDAVMAAPPAQNTSKEPPLSGLY